MGKGAVLVSLLAAGVLVSGCMGDECDDAWEPDVRRGSVCASAANVCTQMRTNPDRPLRFVANIGTAGGGGSRSNRAACVARFMRERGVSDVTIAADATTVTAVGTLRRLGPALEFKTVTNYNVSCSAEGCATCAAASVEACRADAFCTPLVANPLDAERQCLGPAVDVGCQAAGTSCDPAVTWATSPAGVCHLFGSGCLPAAWTSGAACAAGVTTPACTM